MKRLLCFLLASTLFLSCESEPGRQTPDSNEEEAQTPNPSDALAAQRLPFGLFRDVQTGEELMVLQDDSQGTRVYYSPSRTGEWKHLKANANQAQRSFCFEGGTCHSLLPSDAGSGGIACHNPDGSRQFFSRIETTQREINCLQSAMLGFPYYTDERFMSALESIMGGGPEGKLEYDRNAMATTNGAVSRLNDSTYLVKTTEREITLISMRGDFTSHIQVYYFVGYAPEIYSYIFSVNYLEGNTFLLVHEKTGSKMMIQSLPAPNPFNRGEFLSIHSPFMGAAYSGSEFTMYYANELGYNKLWNHPEFAAGEQPDWGICRPIWLSTNQVALMKSYLNESESTNTRLGFPLVEFPVLLTRNGTNWELKPFHIN